ncbi:MAG: hypothetical protein LAT55_09970 [Opitutales bacterium]|nr:hypothetical protein [Opitutales bacterium]
MPNRPGFYGGTESSPEARKDAEESSAAISREAKNWHKKLAEQEADLLRYAEQLDRREQELSQQEQQYETQSLELSERIALFEARKKLLQRKEDRLRELEAKYHQNQSAPDPPSTIQGNRLPESHFQEEEQKIKEKEQFLNSCEELLLRKSQQLSEKQVELDQLAEELGKAK